MLELKEKEVDINQKTISDKSYGIFTSAIWPFRKYTEILLLITFIFLFHKFPL